MPQAARKISKNVTNGHAYIKSTFNNTIVSSRIPRARLSPGRPPARLASRGRVATPFAAQLAAEAAARRAQEHGMKKVDVFVKGSGSGRETTIRSCRPPASRSVRSRTSPSGLQRHSPAEAPPRLIAGREGAASLRLNLTVHTPLACSRRFPYPVSYSGHRSERNRRAHCRATHPDRRKVSDLRSRFTLEPLEPGFGYTLGNSCVVPSSSRFRVQR